LHFNCTGFRYPSSLSFLIFSFFYAQKKIKNQLNCGMLFLWPGLAWPTPPLPSSPFSTGARTVLWCFHLTSDYYPHRTVPSKTHTVGNDKKEKTHHGSTNLPPLLATNLPSHTREF